mmetsp:Transcript_13683/g.31451  ORF Transcript_13683/g.31451 Transcript_13683/m.31451 type:complete len:350 (-) Transcript_13683:163-1212(-)
MLGQPSASSAHVPPAHERAHWEPCDQELFERAVTARVDMTKYLYPHVWERPCLLEMKESARQKNRQLITLAENGTTSGSFLDLISHEDLCCELVRWLRAVDVARCACASVLACRALFTSNMVLACAEAMLVRVGDGGIVRTSTLSCATRTRFPFLAPLLTPLLTTGGDWQITQWTLERVHLCEAPPLPLIRFSFADDSLDHHAHRAIAQIADVLRRHPNVRVRVCGHSRPSGPPALCAALAQARAAAVRCALLRRLADVLPWSKEDASAGVREGGYDEGDDLDEVLEFYEVRLIGSGNMEAQGLWHPSGRKLPEGESNGQCVQVEVRGLTEPHQDPHTETDVQMHDQST